MLLHNNNSSLNVEEWKTGNPLIMSHIWRSFPLELKQYQIKWNSLQRSGWKALLKVGSSFCARISTSVHLGSDINARVHYALVQSKIHLVEMFILIM